MTSTTILTVLLVMSFIIGRLLRQVETPHFVFSGMIYLIFGLLVGPHLGLGLLSVDLLYKLEPLTDLLTGIAGFLLGLRVRLLLRNKKTFASGILTGLSTFAVMSVVLFFISPFAVNFSEGTLDLSLLGGLRNDLDKMALAWIPGLDGVNRIQFWFALGASATACSASLLSLGMISKFHKTTTEITRALSIMAPSGQFIAVVLLGLVLALAHGDTTSTEFNIPVVAWFSLTIVSGFLCGLLFSLFIGHQSNENRVLLAALGAIIFAAGIGTTLNISSMFICFLTGTVISLFSSYATILKENLIRLEEPIFVLLLIIGGATWAPEIKRIWLFPAAYFLIRAVVFSIMAQFIHRKLTQRKLTRLGQGLLGQDLIAVAIALSLAKEFPGSAQLFLTTILGSIFLNDIVANSLLKKVISDNEQASLVEPIAKEEGAR